MAVKCLKVFNLHVLTYRLKLASFTVRGEHSTTANVLTIDQPLSLLSQCDKGCGMDLKRMETDLSSYSRDFPLSLPHQTSHGGLSCR